MADVYKLKIRWTKDLTFEEVLNYEDDKHEYLYMVLGMRRSKGQFTYKILYIGMTYKVYLSQRLRRHHKLEGIQDDQYKKSRIMIRFGTIILPEGKRISEQIVKNVEAILIHESSPEYNEMSRSAYWGDRDYKITNLGTYRPLSKSINTTSWELI